MPPSKPLPTHGEYYRPTRARELRRQADGLECGWLQVLGVMAALVASMTLPAALFFLVGLREGGFSLWFALLAGLALAGGCSGLISWVLMLQHRIRADRQTASALEWEHQARYGEG